MSPKDYIETVAAELGRLRGKGLVLSSADSVLALRWHRGDVPVAAVVDELRRAVRLRSRAGSVRGATSVGLSLQTIAPSVEGRFRLRTPKPRPPPDEGLGGELARAVPQSLPAREAWLGLARRADALVAEGAEAYWTAAVEALRTTLRELPRPSVRKVSAALRARMAPRPRGMPAQSYKRSLQLMLLSAASDELGVPPKAFLL